MSDSNLNNDVPTNEYELLKLLIEQIQKNNTNSGKTGYDTVSIVLIVLFGLILCQKVFKYGRQAYRHYSAVNTRHNSEDSTV